MPKVSTNIGKIIVSSFILPPSDDLFDNQKCHIVDDSIDRLILLILH